MDKDVIAIQDAPTTFANVLSALDTDNAIYYLYFSATTSAVQWLMSFNVTSFKHISSVQLSQQTPALTALFYDQVSGRLIGIASNNTIASSVVINPESGASSLLQMLPFAGYMVAFGSYLQDTANYTMVLSPLGKASPQWVAAYNPSAGTCDFVALKQSYIIEILAPFFSPYGGWKNAE